MFPSAGNGERGKKAQRGERDFGDGGLWCPWIMSERGDRSGGDGNVGTLDLFNGVFRRTKTTTFVEQMESNHEEDRR